MAVTAETSGAVAFKGRMMTLTVLEIRQRDQAVIDTEIARHVERAPDFFRGMPVVLSLSESGVELASVVALLRRHDLVPVAILDGDPETAGTAGLGVIASQRMPADNRGGGAPRETTARRQSAGNGHGDKAPAPRGAARLVERPVRSGQQIYARDSDLVVTSAVSEGAEVLADGHIHIYGALRGRALAGAAGDAGARIFSHRFEPDLVAVAGCYKVADDIDEGVRGQSVQVCLQGDNLIIEAQE